MLQGKHWTKVEKKKKTSIVNILCQSRVINLILSI